MIRLFILQPTFGRAEMYQNIAIPSSRCSCRKQWKIKVENLGSWKVQSWITWRDENTKNTKSQTNQTASAGLIRDQRYRNDPDACRNADAGLRQLTNGKNADAWLTFFHGIQTFLHRLMIFIPSITPAATLFGRARVYPFLPPPVWTCTVWSIQYLSTVIKFFKCIQLALYCK